jgi:PucR family transcriptional regulator, purine catabolism regulatory protein
MTFADCRLGVAMDGSLPTVADVVAMPPTQLGRPEVVAGKAFLSRRVRWLHVSELEDIAAMLRGGELILTTGIALPKTDDALTGYVSQLTSAGASGVILELGRRFESAPTALVKACAKHRLPLIVLHRQVEFVGLTEAVHERILEQQMASLRASERAHEVFTTLSVTGASVAEIVQTTSRMTGAPVVFEDLMRHALAYDAGDMPVDTLLHRWEARSREALTTERTAICGPEEWAVTSVEVHGQVFGRLILLPPERATVEQLMILERAATALTLNRLLERDRETVELQAQRSILADIIEERFNQDSEVFARTESIGVTLRRRAMIGVLIQHASSDSVGTRSGKDLTLIVAGASRAAGVSVLLTAWADGAVGALVVLGAAGDRPAALAALAREIRKGCRSGPAPLISAGSTVTGLSEVRRSFSEASQVARAAPGCDDSKPYHELPDIGIRGLMFTLAGDSRLQAFVARTLDPLLDYDAHHGTSLLAVLAAYLECHGNKSEAARKACMSRQSFYERLDTIARLLDVDLMSGEACTSLHTAVMALDAEHAAVRVAGVGSARRFTGPAISSVG